MLPVSQFTWVAGVSGITGMKTGSSAMLTPVIFPRVTWTSFVVSSYPAGLLTERVWCPGLTPVNRALPVTFTWHWLLSRQTVPPTGSTETRMAVESGFRLREASALLIWSEVTYTVPVQFRYPFSVTTTVCQALPSAEKVAGVISQFLASIQASAPDGVEETVILPGGTRAREGTARKMSSTRRSAVFRSSIGILGCGCGRGIRFLGGPHLLPGLFKTHPRLRRMVLPRSATGRPLRKRKDRFFFLHPCRFQWEEGYRILFNAAGRSIFIRNNLRCIVRENRA
jgi:hypothetical protein